jgi:6-phosphogluconolactonase
MNIEVLADPAVVAQKGASIIATEAQAAIAARGTFVMAVSGGQIPWLRLRDLAAMEIPCQAVHIVQVDERVAPEGQADRNLTHFRESVLNHAPLPPGQIHAMPLEATDLERAAADYAEALRNIAGDPPVLDLVHLGLGADGHTASLVPDDPGAVRGGRGCRLKWAISRLAPDDLDVTGSQSRQEESVGVDRKREGGDMPPFAAGYRSIPAGGIRRDRTLVLADCAAAARSHSLIKGEVVCA